MGPRTPSNAVYYGSMGQLERPPSMPPHSQIATMATQEVLDLWPNSGTVRVADVAALADRWQRRWPSARHASPAATLTVANMRHLLLNALWKQLPAASAAQQRDRTVPSELPCPCCNAPMQIPHAAFETHLVARINQDDAMQCIAQQVTSSFDSHAEHCTLQLRSTPPSVHRRESGLIHNTLLPQVVGRLQADTILRGAATLVSQGFPDSADNLLQHHLDLAEDSAPLAALRTRLSVYNAQESA